MVAGYAAGSGATRPYTGTLSSTGRASAPAPGTVSVPFGSANHAFCPPYQIAIHPSLVVPATAYDCPATAVAPQSLGCVPPAAPSGCSAGSDSSGASARGAVRSRTELLGWLPANRGAIVTT